jgi:hypothetical protein
MAASTPKPDDDLRRLADAARDLADHLDRLHRSGGSLPGEQLQRIQGAMVSLKAIVDEETQKNEATKPARPRSTPKRKVSTGKAGQSSPKAKMKSVPKAKRKAGGK